MTDNTPRMPAIFFGHGNPMLAIQPNHYTETWRRIGASLPRPKAILAVSAHWYTRGTAVTAMEKPPTIHDFGGFPKALFDVQYPAPGSPELAARIQHLLKPAPVHMDQTWGLDHGTWAVLLHAFPEADIPVVQLSVDADQPAAEHYERGRRLGVLRDEGVLVIATGNVVHNLRQADWGESAPPRDWAVRFNRAVRERIEARNHSELIEYAALGPDAPLAVPTPEHFLPLLYILGQQRDDERISFPLDGIDMGSISMLSVAVGMPK